MRLCPAAFLPYPLAFRCNSNHFCVGLRDRLPVLVRVRVRLCAVLLGSSTARAVDQSIPGAYERIKVALAVRPEARVARLVTG